MAAPLISCGVKKDIIWHCRRSVGTLSRSSTPGSTCMASFCIHLLSSALWRAAAFLGLLAAQPAQLCQGEGSCCGAEGGRDDVPFTGRATVMAVPSEAWSAGSASAFR